MGLIGFLRIAAWQHLFASRTDPTTGYYGSHYVLIGFTVFLSVIGVALWGTLAGSLLPLLLKRLRLDPASACAPLVATLVDVTGLVIYFTVASLTLRGTLL